MKRGSVLIFCLLFLFIACEQRPGGSNEETVIDWVDFVNVNDEKYTALYTGVIADADFVGEEIGEVEFKVDENITDPNYKTKDGDAAFWEEGTKIFEVKEMPNYIAIRADDEINDYRIYQSEAVDEQWDFTAIDKKAVKNIHLYEGYNDPQLLHTISDRGKITSFVDILDSGEVKPEFTPDISEGDPTLYHIVFDTGGVIANYSSLFYDGTVWYWHSDNTAILSKDIESYIYP